MKKSMSAAVRLMCTRLSLLLFLLVPLAQARAVQRAAPEEDGPSGKESEKAGVVSVPEAEGISNHPPHFLRISPYLELHQALQARPHRTLRFTVLAKDPDGHPLTYRMKGMPKWASFDSVNQQFSWAPQRHQLGEHTLIFEASDGELTASLAVQVEVRENRPPLATHHELSAQVGKRFKANLAAQDLDGDSLKYEAKGLPDGAVFNTTTAMLFWTPSEDQRGTHTFGVKVSDGELVAHYQVHVDVSDLRMNGGSRGNGEEWESYLQPGLGYGIYTPAASDAFGLFHGVNLELSIVSWIHRNDHRGPSHGRLYLKAEIMPSTKEDVSQLFVYSLGMTLSLERNPRRKWLIPYYGIEFGGLTQEVIGGAFQSSFSGGAHLWAGRNLFVNLSAGYRLVPQYMKDLGGFQAGASIDFSLW